MSAAASWFSYVAVVSAYKDATLVYFPVSPEVERPMIQGDKTGLRSKRTEGLQLFNFASSTEYVEGLRSTSGPPTR